MTSRDSVGCIRVASGHGPVERAVHAEHVDTEDRGFGPVRLDRDEVPILVGPVAEVSHVGCERCWRRVVVQRSNGDVGAVLGFDLGQQLHRQERMSAKIEERLIRVDRFDPRDGREQPGEVVD